MTSDKLVIETSKTKKLAHTVGCIAFIALGFWCLSLDAADIRASHRVNTPAVFYGIGIATIAFFGFGLIVNLRWLFSSKPGLELSPKGVTIYAMKNTFIPWNDISGFSIYEMQKTKILVVNLIDPNKYIEMGGEMRRRMAMMSYKLCGSPISISSGCLKLSFEELREHFEHYLKRYRNID